MPVTEAAVPTLREMGMHDMTDLERRAVVGEELSNLVASRGLSGLTVDYNIVDALPPATHRQLEEHGVPHEAYGGRAIGTATALMLQVPSTVRGRQPFEPEQEFIADLAERYNIEAPSVVSPDQAVPDDVFVYPFIGSAELNQRFPGRTIADAASYNNKATMRRDLRELCGDDSLVPGGEVFYDGQDPDEYFDLVEQALREQAGKFGEVWLKPAGTASGLQTRRYTAEELGRDDASRNVQSALRQMFVGKDGEVAPSDVIFEEHTPFGKPGQPLDINLRGFKLPNGLFVPLTVGRQISTKEGEYTGGVMVSSDDPESLAAIGLPGTTLARAVGITARMAAGMERYPFGAVSVDFFADPNADPQKQVRHRDFNIREGGTSFGGMAAAMRHDLWPDAAAVLDVELKAYADDRLSDGQLRGVVAAMYREGIVPYATTFLNYPKETADGVQYTMKMAAPHRGDATSDTTIIRGMHGLADQINGFLPNQKLRFSSPL